MPQDGGSEPGRLGPVQAPGGPAAPRRRREVLPGVAWPQWVAAGAVLFLLLAVLVLIRVTGCEPPPAKAAASPLEELP